jgi:hypothetical protein
MATKYASGKNSIAECDRCGQRYKLVQLKKLTIKTKQVSIKVCPECWEPDQPQLHLGIYPVWDPQAVREPRPDTSYYTSGTTGLLTNKNDANINNVDDAGYPNDGSRQIQWGWAPVGGASQFDTVLTPNDLISVGNVGTVTVTTT